MTNGSMIEVVFWLSVGVILYVYIGYPAYLFFGSGRRGESRRSGEAELPKVSIVISAFNERNCIGATIANKLSLDYPAEKREIIVTSDDSSDGTDDVVRTFVPDGVRLIRQTPRQGKTAALNSMVAEATGDIVVFSDANSMYERNALRKLVRNFADPEVGYVTGKMIYVDRSGSVIGSGCTAYMRYENSLRGLESRFGSVIGVDGGIDAVRRSLYRPMAPDLLPDFVLPLMVMRAGKRVVFEGEALLMEPTLTDRGDEWSMRVRVILRSFHALAVMRELLNPFRFPRASFQIVSHKVLRYLVGIFQVLALAGNLVLAGDSVFYSIVLLLQAAFYVMAILGAVRRFGRWIPAAGYAYYFCLLNSAALVALVKFARGERQVTWTPRKG